MDRAWVLDYQRPMAFASTSVSGGVVLLLLLLTPEYGWLWQRTDQQPKQHPWGSPMICCCPRTSLQIQFVSDALMLLFSGRGEWLQAPFHRSGNG